jgi:hypothetical protein
VRAADWGSPDQAHAVVVTEMKRFLSTDELQFLMELSIEPVATQLGLAAGGLTAMDLQLGGKRALVTGSSGGIGEAIAKALAPEGTATAVHGP